MPKPDHFEELRRMAFDRGMADYHRAREQAEPGKPLWKNNPHQNNFATDEREEWERGWQSAADEFATLNVPAGIGCRYCYDADGGCCICKPDAV